MKLNIFHLRFSSIFFFFFLFSLSFYDHFIYKWLVSYIYISRLHFIIPFALICIHQLFLRCMDSFTHFLFPHSLLNFVVVVIFTLLLQFVVSSFLFLHPVFVVVIFSYFYLIHASNLYEYCVLQQFSLKSTYKIYMGIPYD